MKLTALKPLIVRFQVLVAPFVSSNRAIIFTTLAFGLEFREQLFGKVECGGGQKWIALLDAATLSFRI